ncbi:uncharacterized protein [Periplaneta americana]|uniref:uncharacterized protein n=1 Tax=Periplaneta americana TaxID=6978 RepID=UPI0037E76BD4
MSKRGNLYLQVLHLLNPEDSACINSAILAADDVGIQSELSYIGAHIKTLPETMTILEERGLHKLSVAVSLLNTVTTSFNKLPGSMGIILTEKVKKIEERNPGLETVKKISGILQVHINPQPSDQEEEKELVGALTEKKLPTEGCTGVRGRRRYQMLDIKIYGSYEETKRKAENRKDWRKLGLQ